MFVYSVKFYFESRSRLFFSFCYFHISLFRQPKGGHLLMNVVLQGLLCILEISGICVYLSILIDNLLFISLKNAEVACHSSEVVIY